MDLQFTKIEGKDLYAAEAVVNADFNIHLERTAASRLNILQRTPTEGDFEPVYLPSNVQNNTGKTFDCDFSALVYPKTIRIESYTEVTTGILTEAE
jgi:hypothetical protein